MFGEMILQTLKRYWSWFLVAFGVYSHPRARIRRIKILNYKGYSESRFYETIIKIFPEILSGQMAAKGKLIHEDRHKKSYLYTPPSLASLPLYVKNYKRRHLLQDLKDIFRGSQAKKSFLLALTLEGHGISTPQPLALLERWKMGIRKESFLVCQGYLNSLPAAVLFKTLYEQKKDEAFAQALQAFSAFITKIEKAGIRHGSLMSSILAVFKPGEPPSYYLTDLDQILTVGAINEHDCFRMAWDVHQDMNFHKKECLPALYEEGNRIHSRILQHLAEHM